MTSLLVHGTTVALGETGVMLRGSSGAGKSDLALRFLADQGRWPAGDARRALVTDDQTLLTATPDGLVASAPAVIAGKLEVRGVGIIELTVRGPVGLRLIVELVSPGAVERLPEMADSVTLLGCTLPVRRLAPFELSSALKLALLIRSVETIVPDLSLSNADNC